MKLFALLLSILASVTACASNVKIAPVTVHPIHITVDVNLRDKPADAAAPSKDAHP